MKTLKEAVAEYLALTAWPGFQAEEAFTDAKEFASFLEGQGRSRITSQLALQWATEPQNIQQSEWAARLSVGARFCALLECDGPGDRDSAGGPAAVSATVVPSPTSIPMRDPPTARSRARTCDPRTACSLDIPLPLGSSGRDRTAHQRGAQPPSTDVDWSEGVLTNPSTAKFGKSRLIPLHGRPSKFSRDYDAAPGPLFDERKTPYFFCSRRDGRLDEGQVRRVFYVISRQIGIRGASASHGPRLHDFRHRFAVQTLLHWHRQEKMFGGVYRSCPPISATDMSPIPTGT